jgi:hypothetical protein
VKIDPLANIAQVLDGQQVVTSFAVIVDEKNQRLYQREHRMALMQLWRTQYRIPKPKRRVKGSADVATRSLANMTGYSLSQRWHHEQQTRHDYKSHGRVGIELHGGRS